MNYCYSTNCENLIIHYETGDKIENYLTSYLCPAGIWTIGIGSTSIYGTSVKKGDKITIEQALELFKLDLVKFSKAVNSMVTNKNLIQNQFDSLVSFTYNLGCNSLKKSTLLKIINSDVNDKNIPSEFAKWCYAGGKKLLGLIARRKSEALLYTNGELKFFN